MKITVAGSGTVVPRMQRRQACVVLQIQAETVVLDLGSGAVRGMVKAGLDPLSIDRIFFTHFHPDHTSDIVPLLFSMNYGGSEKRSKPLNIYGPAPFHRFWNGVTTAWGEWMTGDFPLSVTELPVTYHPSMNLPGYKVTWAPAKHRPESIAYRVESEDKVFVYTGDTEYCESVVELSRQADTLLIECSFPDSQPVAGHLTPGSVARIASEADVRRVVLTHIYPAAEATDLAGAVQNGFGGEVIVAEDGMTLRV